MDTVHSGRYKILNIFTRTFTKCDRLLPFIVYIGIYAYIHRIYNRPNPTGLYMSETEYHT